MAWQACLTFLHHITALYYADREDRVACLAWYPRSAMDFLKTSCSKRASGSCARRPHSQRRLPRLGERRLSDGYEAEAGHFPSTVATPVGRAGDTSFAEDGWRGQRHRTNVRKSDRFARTDTAVTARD